ncbi:glycine betaine ABC transporter substrate-binding protein [Devosia sp. A449]
MQKPMRVLAIAALAAFSTASVQAAAIVVGGKGFTEQLLLAEITAQLLTNEGFEVEKRDGLGTQVVRDAQVNGQIDVYWEYTGTSLVTFNKIDDRLTAEETYALVSELDAEVGLTWLDPSRTNNTYAVAVRGADEKTDAMVTVSDMAQAYNDGVNLTMAMSTEFPGRPDGLPGLEETYDFKTTRAQRRAMDPGLVFPTLRDGHTDIGLVTGTDGRIPAFNFRILEDDKGFFPNYAAVPVVRTVVLEANPELAAPLNAMSAVLTDELMRAMNAQVDIDNTSIEEVAKQFLADNDLL